ncbi:MAG: hypothetical protein HQ580_03360 [Planctomycetes bacterium]|nr:hypothetical protein [Planctomycetota bacterium]
MPTDTKKNAFTVERVWEKLQTHQKLILEELLAEGGKKKASRVLKSFQGQFPGHTIDDAEALDTLRMSNTEEILAAISFQKAVVSLTEEIMADEDMARTVVEMVTDYMDEELRNGRTDGGYRASAEKHMDNGETASWVITQLDLDMLADIAMSHFHDCSFGTGIMSLATRWEYIDKK